ncbi:MAG: class II aldolase/adducin family protein [Candidatus Eremiobacteraeota bacterium]|nr:class II aldolase/adducin family protein [Candidatus Eremiobacteraeota bacterium]
MKESVEIKELVKISQYAGSDILLVQGGGGNASVKSRDKRKMWIKASGFRLSEVTDEKGYVVTDLRSLVSLMHSKKMNHKEFSGGLKLSVIGDSTLRPSMETGFHAVLPRVVLHTNPVYVNAFACMEDGELAIMEVMNQEMVWVKYKPPGFELSVEVDRVCRGYSELNGHLPPDIILRNHGFIACGDSADKVISSTGKFVDAGKRFFGELHSDALLCTGPPDKLVKWAGEMEKSLQEHFKQISYFARATKYSTLLDAALDVEMLLESGPLVPDDVVYYSGKVLPAEISNSSEKWISTRPGPLPGRFIIAVEGYGVVFVGPSYKTIDTMEENFLANILVRTLISGRGSIRSLPPDEIETILNMDAEKYRQALAAKDV